MNRIIIISIFVFSLSMFLFCSSNEDEENSSGENPNKMIISSDCKKAVDAYEGEIVENLIGSFVVTGNEPHTRLMFKTVKTEEKEAESYRVVEECEKELWNLQGFKLKISGKVDEHFLETVTGKKMRVLVLYPVSVEKIKEEQ